VPLTSDPDETLDHPLAEAERPMPKLRPRAADLRAERRQRAPILVTAA
jgi:hypothetical protein